MAARCGGSARPSATAVKRLLIVAVFLLAGVFMNVAVVSFFHVPGPGALWLLGAMGLLGSRRRR